MRQLMSRSLPCRRDGVVVRGAGQAPRLEDPATGTIHSVNATALALWELCDGETTVAEMVEAVCSLFAVDPRVARRDVRRTLTAFTEKSLIRWQPPPPSPPEVP